MSTLTDLMSPAIFSEDRRYRYLLSRRVGLADGEVLFIMLNPSTANEIADDPTIRRCKGFARDWGYGVLTVCNLFAYCTADPDVLRRVDDPVGPDNDAHIATAASRAAIIVCAWGAFKEAAERAIEVQGDLRRAGRTPMCLGLTATGHPKHPLYIPKTQPLQEWTK